MWHLWKRLGSRAALSVCFILLIGAWITILSLSLINDWATSEFLDMYVSARVVR